MNKLLTTAALLVMLLGGGIIAKELLWKSAKSGGQQNTNVSVTPADNVDTVLASPVVEANKNSNPVQMKAKVLRATNANPQRVIFIYTPIDFYSMELATKKLQELDQTQGEIYVLLSSPGGSVFAGESFITAMQSARNRVNTVCVDFCASMAAIIHQHGTKRYAYDRATLMFHDASGGAQGQMNEMVNLLSYINRKLEKTNRYIASRSKLSYEQFKQMATFQDLWIDAEDAQAHGLVDDLIKVIPASPQDEQILIEMRKLRENGTMNVIPLTVDILKSNGSNTTGLTTRGTK